MAASSQPPSSPTLNPRLASIRALYDARSSVYDSSPVHIALCRDYITWAQLKPGDNLLDLGTGTGLVALAAKCIVGATGRVVGVDVSEGMLDVARRKAAVQGLDIRFENGDIGALDRGWEGARTEAGGFDVITCAAALILLQDPLSAVKSWKKLLKPGGRLITDVQTRSANVVMNVFGKIADKVGERVPWNSSRWIEQKELEEVMVEADLKIERAWETDAYESTRFEVGDDSEIFDKAVKSAMFENFGREEVRERARELFVEEFQRLAGSSGVIEQETRYWVVDASSSR